jgi:hypothetical protein
LKPSYELIEQVFVYVQRRGFPRFTLLEDLLGALNAHKRRTLFGSYGYGGGRKSAWAYFGSSRIASLYSAGW